MPLRRSQAGSSYLVALGILSVVAIAALLFVGRWCSVTRSELKEGLDALRTDKTWRDALRGMAPVDAEAFAASFRELDDGSRHPRMGHGVVVRGTVRGVDLSSPGQPMLVLEGGAETVRCLFDPVRIERLKTLQSGQTVVIGGTLRGVVGRSPELAYCHFEAEWNRR